MAIKTILSQRPIKTSFNTGTPNTLTAQEVSQKSENTAMQKQADQLMATGNKIDTALFGNTKGTGLYDTGKGEMSDGTTVTPTVTPTITKPTTISPTTTPTQTSTPSIPTLPTVGTPTTTTPQTVPGVTPGTVQTTPGVTTPTGATTPTKGTDILTEANLPEEYKGFYNTLSEAEKKQFIALGEQSQKAGQDIAEGYANYMRDYNTVKTRNEQDRADQMNQEAIQQEMDTIQSSQTLRKSRQQVDKLIQSVAYLGTQGMPGKSQARLTGVQNQINEAETTFKELVRLQDLATSARKAGYARTALMYERQMEDLNTKLNDNIDKSIQEAYNSLVSADQNGQIDTVQEIENFRLKMLNDLDSKITGITDASIQQRQFLIQRYDKIVEDAKTFEANKNTINKEMSAVQGFYVDGNGSPIVSATTGQSIKIPPDAPIDPIFDQRNGTVVSFTTDENGMIQAKVDKVMDTATFEQQTLMNYAKLVANGKMGLGDLQELGLSDDMIQQVISESAGIQPTQEAKPPIQVGNQTYQYNPSTNQYQPVTPSSIGGGGTSGDLRGLAGQFPGQAWAKNNNPAGITWNANFDNPTPGSTAQRLIDAGIQFSKGTSRPASEGGNYVTFNTIEDGLKAQRIMMSGTYGNSTVGQMLQKWVGTSEGPNYARQVAGNAGIDVNTKVSDLSDMELNQLQMAKIQKESPGLYKLLTQAPKDDSMQALSLTQGLGGTEGERQKFADNIIAVSQRDGISLQEAKKKLGYKSADDVAFAKTRKEEITSLKKDTRDKLSNANTALTLLNQPQTAIGDVASVVGFLKTIDPSSVARESEVASVENARGILDSLSNVFAKAKEGTKLTNEQRRQLKDSIQTIVNAGNSKYDEYLGGVIQEFNDRGLDPTVYISKGDVERLGKSEVKQDLQINERNQGTTGAGIGASIGFGMNPVIQNLDEVDNGFFGGAGSLDKTDSDFFNNL